jgi:hypothetical protein
VLPLSPSPVLITQLHGVSKLFDFPRDLFDFACPKLYGQSPYQRVVKLATHGGIGTVHRAVNDVVYHGLQAVLDLAEFDLRTTSTTTLTAPRASPATLLFVVWVVVKAPLTIRDSLRFASAAIGFNTGT